MRNTNSNTSYKTGNPFYKTEDSREEIDIKNISSLIQEAQKYKVQAEDNYHDAGAGILDLANIDNELLNEFKDINQLDEANV